MKVIVLLDLCTEVQIIEPAMLPTILDRFNQITASLGLAREGLGIGLALVRNLIELNGGWVQAASATRPRKRVRRASATTSEAHDLAELIC